MNHKYDAQLFTLAKQELCKLSNWQGATNITWKTQLSVSDVQYIFDGLTKQLYLDQWKCSEEDFQKKYHKVMKRSFYNKKENPTLRKTINVFTSMFHKTLPYRSHILKPLPIDPEYENLGSSKTKKTVMTEQEMINFINEHCSDSITIHNGQIR